MLDKNILFDLETKLNSDVKNKLISKNTAQAYLNAAKNLFKGITNKRPYDVELKDIKKDDIEKFLVNIRTKTKFSMYKNSLKRLKSLYKNLDIPDEEFFKNESLKRRDRRKKAPGPINESQIKRKINSLKDKKLKLGYRLALANGLRISEVSNLRKEDIQKIEEGKLHIKVKKGKGDKNRDVIGLEDKYLESELKEYIEDLDNKDKIFYSDQHMKNKASDLGFECHDLRRIFAQNLYQEEKKNCMHKGEAKQKVKQQLGHTRIKTTNIYLKRKIVK